MPFTLIGVASTPDRFAYFMPGWDPDEKIEQVALFEGQPIPPRNCTVFETNLFQFMNWNWGFIPEWCGCSKPVKIPHNVNRELLFLRSGSFH